MKCFWFWDDEDSIYRDIAESYSRMRPDKDIYNVDGYCFWLAIIIMFILSVVIINFIIEI